MKENKRKGAMQCIYSFNFLILSVCMDIKMKRYQRRNRSGLVKERWIMATTSVFVLGALTLTGVYVRDINKQSSDGYVVDFSALENNASSKIEEIQETQLAENTVEQVVPSDDLDADPYFQEANSRQIENYEPADSLPQSVKEKIGSAEIIPEIKQQETTQEILAEIASDNLEVGEAVMAAEPEIDTEAKANTKTEAKSEAKTETKPEESKPDDIAAISTSMQSALTFKEGDNLVWPIVGNVLINYSMDKTVYFPTLQQYKYNPAIIIQATEGEIISAAAAGKVTKVYNDSQIGNAIIVELGDGYELTYGQLGNVLVSEGSYVSAGDVIAEVAAPTKYYSVEGTNVYFKLTKDGSPVNPMTKLN